ncbi:MAG: hypothetical protein MZV65_32040 [Chromatiales bacterium]|nr:hypothetical protein [Chromatiales bacterium]
MIRADLLGLETIRHLRHHGYPHERGGEMGRLGREDGVEFLRSFERIASNSAANTPSRRRGSGASRPIG